MAGACGHEWCAPGDECRRGGGDGFTVIAVYRDNQEPWAQYLRTRDAERAAELAQLIASRALGWYGPDGRRCTSDDQPLIIASVVAGSAVLVL